MPLHRPLFTSLVLLAVATAAPAQQPTARRPAGPRPAAPAGAPRVKPFDVANLDTTCAPCKDFFQYANGGWIKSNPIPPAYSSWGAFSELDERNRATLHSILDDLAAKVATAPAGSNAQKLGTFYATCTDSARTEADGAAPIADE